MKDGSGSLDGELSTQRVKPSLRKDQYNSELAQVFARCITALYLYSDSSSFPHWRMSVKSRSEAQEDHGFRDG